MQELTRHLPVLRATVALVLVAFFAGLMWQLTTPYFSFKIDAAFLATKQAIIHIAHWRYAFYVHVFTSMFALLTGVVQFIKPLAYRYKKIHRALGIVYVVTVVLLSGPSGLVMGFYANGGLYAKVSFVLLSVLWVVFTALAFSKARSGKITAHQQWMVRSYALTLSAIALRLYAYVLPGIIHLNGRDEYVLIAWLSWVPNLLIAELLVRTGKTHF